MNSQSLKSTFGNTSNLYELRQEIDVFFDSIQNEKKSLQFCYIQLLSSSLEKPLIYLHNRFPEEWQAIYDKKNYHLIDPSWKHAKKSSTPFFWSDLKDLSKEEQDMVDDALRHGLRSGVLIPFHGRHGYSLLWITSDTEENECLPALVKAKNLSYQSLPYIFDAVNRVIFENKNILTRRETEVLYWTAEGLKTQDVAEKLFISAVTVEKHVANACQKLEARNRTHCVRIAYNLGLLVAGETQFNYSIQ